MCQLGLFWGEGRKKELFKLGGRKQKRKFRGGKFRGAPIPDTGATWCPEAL